MTTINFIPSKIISGGQTGVDRAALDAALKAGIDIGGYIPKGALAEDGKVPPRYNLKETRSSEYAQRTILNVKLSDATLILYRNNMEGGTFLTYQICKKNHKPVLALDIETDHDDCIEQIRDFLNKNKYENLNIAGPRESKSNGIYKQSYELLLKTLTL